MCLKKLINGNTESAVYDFSEVFIICLRIPVTWKDRDRKDGPISQS